MRSDRFAEALVAAALLVAFVTDVRALVPLTAIALLAAAWLGHARPQAVAGALALAGATALMETGSEVAAWAVVLTVVTAAGLGASTGARVLAGAKH